MRPKAALDHNNSTFSYKYFFSLSHNCIYSSFKSKQTTNVYYFCLLTIFFSHTLPRTRNYERDLWLYWAWQQVTRWHASRSTIWAWRPFLLNFQINIVSNKNANYSNQFKLNIHFYANSDCHKFKKNFFYIINDQNSYFKILTWVPTRNSEKPNSLWK